MPTKHLRDCQGCEPEVPAHVPGRATTSQYGQHGRRGTSILPLDTGSAYNPPLTSLTLLSSKETLIPRFALTLSMARSLRHLCARTATPTPGSVAEEFFMIMEARLSKLRLLDAHYMSARNMLQALTWIRQWKPDYTEPTIGKWRSSDGLFLDDSPCLGRLCSVTTFIGLARPRNRF